MTSNKFHGTHYENLSLLLIFETGSVHVIQVSLKFMILNLPRTSVMGVGYHTQLRLFLNDPLGDLKTSSSVTWFRLSYLESLCQDAGQTPRLSGTLVPLLWL